jgi:hypothetical protein
MTPAESMSAVSSLNFIRVSAEFGIANDGDARCKSARAGLPRPRLSPSEKRPHRLSSTEQNGVLK